MQTLQVLPCNTAHRQLLRTACATSHVALQSSCTQHFACPIFQHRPALLLERAIGEKLGLDTELWTQAPFVAGVVPDLPVFSSWKQLGAKLLGRCSCGNCTNFGYLIQAIVFNQYTKRIGFALFIKCPSPFYQGAHCRQAAAPQVVNNEEGMESSDLCDHSHRYLVQTVAAQVEQYVLGSVMQLASLESASCADCCSSGRAICIRFCNAACKFGITSKSLALRHYIGYSLVIQQSTSDSSALHQQCGSHSLA